MGVFNKKTGLRSLLILFAVLSVVFAVSGSIGLPDQQEPAALPALSDNTAPQPNITQFSGSQSQIELAFNETTKKGNAIINIPRQANVTNISMKITGLHEQQDFSETRKPAQTDMKYILIQDSATLVDKNRNEHTAWIQGSKIFYKDHKIRLKQVNPVENSILNLEMALDSNNAVHIIWEDGGTYGENLFVPYYANSNDFKARQVGALRSTMNTFPDILLDSQNTAHLIWTHTDGENHSILYSNSADFDEAKKINAKDGINIQPKAVIDSNDIVHVMWIERDTITNEDTIYYANSTNWENTAIKTNLGGSIRDLMVDRENNLHMLWSTHSDTDELYYANSNGWNFEKIDSISYPSNPGSISSYWPSCLSKIAADSKGVIHILSEEFNTDHYDIAYSNSENWADKIKINDANANSLISDFAIDSNDILHAVWSDNRFGNGKDEYDIYYANSIDWKNQRASNSAKLYQGNGKIQILDDTAFVSWRIPGDKLSGGGYEGEILIASTNYTFPENAVLDIGDDGTNEWSYNGKLMGSEIINDASFAEQINSYLQKCGTDTCEVPLAVRAGGRGRILLSGLEIYYTLLQETEEEPEIVSDPADPIINQPVYSSGSGGGGYSVEIQKDIEVILEKGETKTVTAKNSDKINVYAGNEKIVFETKKTTPNLMQFKFLGREIFLTKNEIKKIDLNADGTQDLLIRLKSIEAEKMEISFEAIEQKVLANATQKEEAEEVVIEAKAEERAEKKTEEAEQPKIAQAITGFLIFIEKSFVPVLASLAAAYCCLKYLQKRKRAGSRKKAGRSRRTGKRK